MSKPNLPEQVRRLYSSNLVARLIELRQDLHRHPELSLREERTAQKLYDQLSALNPKELRKVAGTGVVASIAGRNPEAPVIALRGDIDALPIHENTGLPFSSENDGVMHACGHDVHATWTIAAAHLLTVNPAEGDVIILLQPAEEVAGGASAVLASGALSGVAAIFGGHVDRRFAVGQVVAQEGPLAASSDVFEIELKGRGAHGARPHESADPIVCAASVVSSLQTVVSRRLNPAYPGVVTIGTINAGTAPNIIPETARLTGTIRATDAETRELLISEVRKIAEAQAQVFGLTAVVSADGGIPPIVNPPGPVAVAQRAVATAVGEEALVPLGFLNMGGEDFACYMEKMPGCFMRVGAREAGGEVIPAHSPHFYAAEETIFVGGAVLAECARVAGLELQK